MLLYAQILIVSACFAGLVALAAVNLIACLRLKTEDRREERRADVAAARIMGTAPALPDPAERERTLTLAYQRFEEERKRIEDAVAAITASAEAGGRDAQTRIDTLRLATAKA